MEKKKILFVSVIIGLFLFIAIALPLSLLSSKDEELAATQPAVSGVPKPEEAPPERPASMDVRDAIVNPPVAAPGAQNVIINNYDASGNADSESRLAPNEGEPVTITVVPAAPAVQSPAAPASSPSPAAPQSAQNSQSSQSGGALRTTPAKPAAPAAKPAAKSAPSAAKPSSSSRAYNYWIQTGSFATKPYAENAQKALKEKGIPSKIEPAVVKGNNVYRVRSGPYITYSEANYWLKLIKSIDMDGLDKSWIDQISK
ncbi:MAG: SPOR domain-containing protein [Treponema sp.]|jgi:cell division protein FtsN|nr:SPOR domain-containing protein [Treponema sp.]